MANQQLAVIENMPSFVENRESSAPPFDTSSACELEQPIEQSKDLKRGEEKEYLEAVVQKTTSQTQNRHENCENYPFTQLICPKITVERLRVNGSNRICQDFKQNAKQTFPWMQVRPVNYAAKSHENKHDRSQKFAGFD